ncbi:dTDP-4-dehydrorhamnose reductase [Glycocaulis alkaliphilus]|uniref:dTDP-4-dehydrorhamnose reductase n=1 Tax=Glycocaulis alkaliphilus TaxID=1434191 RepID=A0A3T0E898_9PROT|nr:dTDP-4-dehydrorhamnose reductase [Glycocaulis alkaliphilus]
MAGRVEAVARLLILGLTGQLATELIAQAPAEGWEVTALGRDVADFADPLACAAALGELLPADAVINAAAYTAVDRAESEEALAHTINAETPGRLAALCAGRGVPFIHVSTDYVFDGRKSGPYVETDLAAPQTAYGRSKLAGEHAVLDGGGRSLIARTAWVYSAHGHNFLKTMLRLGAERDELRVVDDQHGCPTAAPELARCLLVAARAMAERRSDGGVYHLAGDGQTSWAGFADAIFDHAAPHWKRRPAVIPITTAEYPTPAPRPANSRLDSSRFETGFGTRPFGWEACLGEIVKKILTSEK